MWGILNAVVVITSATMIFANPQMMMKMKAFSSAVI